MSLGKYKNHTYDQIPADYVHWVLQEWERCADTMHPEMCRFAMWAVEHAECQQTPALPRALGTNPLPIEVDTRGSRRNPRTAGGATFSTHRTETMEAARQDDDLVMVPMMVDLVSEEEDA
eukprot:3961457-Amphidinium_carterae.1